MQHWVIGSTADLDRALDAIAAAIADAGIVVVPTESFYALAADVRSPEALERVQRLKGRGSEKPLLVLVSGTTAARRLAPTAAPLLEDLAAQFWPGPLTLLLPAREGLAAPLVGAAGTVAVRVPASTVARRIAGRVGGITGTSANRTGESPPQEVETLGFESDALAGVVDTGRTAGGKPSTLLDITRPTPRIARHGELGEAELRQFLDARLL